MRAIDDRAASHPRYRGPVVDAHCHFDRSARALVKAALDAGGLQGLINFWDLSWPPPSYRRWSSDWAGVDQSMALCHTPDLEGVGREGHEAGLVRGVREARRLGAVAVKVWKNLGLHLKDAAGARLAIDDARLGPLWREAAAAGLPVVIHIGDPPAFFEPLTPDNERYAELRMRPEYWLGGGDHPPLSQLHRELENVVGGFPGTSFVGLHFGCFVALGEVARMLRSYPNLHVDTATRVSDLGREDPEAVRAIFLEFAERIVFGTDLIRTSRWQLPEGWDDRRDLERFYELHWRYFETAERDIPLTLPFQGNWRMRGIDLPQEVLERLYSGNAHGLFAWTPGI